VERPEPGPVDPRPGRRGTPGGTSLVNSGSWIYEPAFLAMTPRAALLAGTCVYVGEVGPPELRRLIT